MARRRNQSTIGPLIKWIVIIALILIVGPKIKDALTITDVTDMKNMNRATLEQTLGVTLTGNPSKVSQIYCYTNAPVSVESSEDGNISIVYFDGMQAGLHIDNLKYSMYGVKMGDAMPYIDQRMTFQFDKDFEMLNDIYENDSTAHFYCNHTTKECLVLVANDMTNRVVAITYFNNLDKALENVSY